MSEEKNVKNEETPVLGIATVLAAILFIALLNKLPFPEDYGFWQLAGIFAMSAFAAGSIFSGAASLVTFIYKAIVEVLVVLLLFGNATCAACFFLYYDDVRTFLFDIDMNINTENGFIVFLICAVVLFILNLIYILFIFPLVRISKSNVLDV